MKFCKDVVGSNFYYDSSFQHVLIMSLLFAKHHINFFLIVMYENCVYQKCLVCYSPCLIFNF